MQKIQKKIPPGNAHAPHPAPKKQKSSELEELKAVLQEKEELYLKMLAEFDNYRKRVAKEGDAAAKATIRELLLGMLAVQDSFDRAFQPEAQKVEPQVYQGMRSIQRQIHQLLEQRNVMSFDSVGQAFNPSLHEAVDTEPSQKFSDGIVSREIERGYVWEEKVLRPAKVVVVQNSRPSPGLDEMA